MMGREGRDLGRLDDVYEPTSEACREISRALGSQLTGLSFGGSDALPAVPGLSVRGVGSVSTPLREVEMAQLKPHCTSLRAGVWQLKGVELTNPEWGHSAQALLKRAADTLGFNGVKLEMEISRVVVLGTGGSLTINQTPTNKVATMLVQMPSEYKGGHTLVFHGDRWTEYELGRVEAAFKTHYVMYSTDAICALGEVTSGYRLLVEYSLCLPKAFPFDGKLSDVKHRLLLQALGKLSGNLDKENSQAGVSGGSSVLALLLSKSKSYKKDEIEARGVDALINVDRERWTVLRDANKLLPQDKQLKFYIAYLLQTTDSQTSTERASWYTIDGAYLCRDLSVQWSTKLNFLNPEKLSLRDLWRGGNIYGYGNFAVVGWPAAVDEQLCRDLMGEIGVLASALASSPIDAVRIHGILCSEDTQKGTENGRQDDSKKRWILKNFPMCPAICHRFTQVMIEGDATLVDAFFRKYFPQPHEKDKLVPLLATIIRNFGWDVVGTLLVTAIDRQVGVNRMELVLQLADELETSPAAQEGLTVFAIRMAQKLVDINMGFLVSSLNLKLLWKHAMLCPNARAFNDVVGVFARIDAKLLGPTVAALSSFIGVPSYPEHQDAISSILKRRKDWITRELKASFLYEILDSEFPDAGAIDEFLKGPKKSLEIRGFRDLTSANDRVELLREKIKANLIVTANVGLQGVYIDLTKTGGMFSIAPEQLQAYKCEVERIDVQLPKDENNSSWNATHTSNAGVKRPREDDLLSELLD